MSQVPEPFLLRVFDPGADYETLCEWWRARGKEPPLKELLPKLAMVAQRGGEDYAMGFLYMDNSTGVCFFEMPATRPGLRLKEMRESLTVVMDFLKIRAAELGYGIMLGYTFPAFVRESKRFGFRSLRSGLTMVYTELKGGNNGN